MLKDIFLGGFRFKGHVEGEGLVYGTSVNLTNNITYHIINTGVVLIPFIVVSVSQSQITVSYNCRLKSVYTFEGHTIYTSLAAVTSK